MDQAVLVVAVFFDLKERFMVEENLDVSGVISLKDVSLFQSLILCLLTSSLIRFAVFQDDVFMIILIKRWRKKRCSTRRNSSRQLSKRS